MRPAQTFKCSMRAALGVGERDNIWAAAANVYYDDMTTDDIKGEFIDNPNNKIHFTVESQGSYDEYDMLIKSCNFIVKKLTDIKNDLNKKFSAKEIVDSNEIIIVLDGEDHTMGELLNFSFQNHPDIIFSGVSKPDHLVNSVKFKIACSEKIKNPIQLVFEQINLLKETYLHIEKLLVKLYESKAKKI